MIHGLRTKRGILTMVGNSLCMVSNLASATSVGRSSEEVEPEAAAAVDAEAPLAADLTGEEETDSASESSLRTRARLA